nr:hypothetical protein [Tanacetum cinerariifolium]
MDQAPAAFDGFAPHWFGEQFLNINNGWMEWDVPLEGEVDEPMVDPEDNEEVMDDDWDVEVEWLMAPVTPPRATMTVPSTYRVGGPSTAAIEGPSFPLPKPRLLVPPTVIENLGTRLGNLEYRHGVLTRKMEEVQVMESQTLQVVSRLEEMETRVQQVENRLDTYPSGQMSVPGQNVIVGSSEQVQTLQMALHETELQNQQLRTRVAEMESHMGIVMPYMLWMEERLTVLEKRLPGPPPRPQLEEMETRVQQVENRLDTYPSGQMSVPGQNVIVGSSEQVQTLQMALHETELQNQQLRTRVAEMESHMGIVMPYMLWMEERLTVLEKRLPGPPPRPQ